MAKKRKNPRAFRVFSTPPGASQSTVDNKIHVAAQYAARLREKRGYRLIHVKDLKLLSGGHRITVSWEMPEKNQTKRKRSAKHRTKNPKQLLFRSAKAARAYAKAHGAKKFSVRKLKRGK